MKKRLWRMGLVAVAAFGMLWCGVPFQSAEVADVQEDASAASYDWEDDWWFDEGDVEVPPLAEMIQVADNRNFTLYFHEEGLDIYVLDKRNNTVWSNAIDGEYIDVGASLPSAYSTLLTVNVAQTDGELQFYNITSGSQTGGLQVDCRYEDDKIRLYMRQEMKSESGGGKNPEGSLALALDMWIDDDGLLYSLPESEIRESGDLMLAGVDVFPSFGAARSDEDGYVFYPDGSGSLISFKPYDMPNAQQYLYPLYGLTEFSIEAEKERDTLGEHALMLPVYGIKRTNDGLFAAVLEGAHDAHLKISMPGFQVPGAYRANFSFDYRTYTSAVYDFGDSRGQDIAVSMLVPERIEGTRTVKYFLLDKQENSYSDMAVKYREELIKREILTPQAAAGDIPLSVELFMGITRPGIVADEVYPLTTYGQAVDILASLKEAGVRRMDVLLTGWGKGGYDTVPTIPQAEGRLGGRTGLDKLCGFCMDNGYNAYASLDFYHADSQKGHVNLGKDALRDFAGQLLTDERESRWYLLNPVRVFESYSRTALEKTPDGLGFNLEYIGNRTTYDYNRKHVTYSEKMIAAYQKAMRQMADSGRRAAVSGGNAFVLPYAERLYQLPDEDSGYFQNDCAVPFYQMVVHGSLPYTSLAANQSHDYTYQKLKWIETGSLPHFLLTQENPIVLKDTEYTMLFSSEYSRWGTVVLDMYKEFNDRLASVWHLKINRHEMVEDQVVRLTYESGAQTLINYRHEPVTVQGMTIPAMDYVVVQ